MPIATLPSLSAAALTAEPDAHGQAALLLTESLMHMLVQTNALKNVDAITTIDIAADVKVEVAEAAGESRGRMMESLRLLGVMRKSFEANDC